MNDTMRGESFSLWDRVLILSLRLWRLRNTRGRGVRRNLVCRWSERRKFVDEAEKAVSSKEVGVNRAEL